LPVSTVAIPVVDEATTRRVLADTDTASEGWRQEVSLGGSALRRPSLQLFSKDAITGIKLPTPER
jgi:hypothetical protein